MRGRLVELRKGRQTLSAGSHIPGVSGASFVELENVEVNVSTGYQHISERSFRRESLCSVIFER